MTLGFRADSVRVLQRVYRGFEVWGFLAKVLKCDRCQWVWPLPQAARQGWGAYGTTLLYGRGSLSTFGVWVTGWEFLVTPEIVQRPPCLNPKPLKP